MVNIDGGAGPDDSDLRVLSRSTIDRLLGLLVPGSSLSSVSLMKGGFTNFTHLVDATAPTGEFMRLVVRWYSDLYQDPAEKARVNTARSASSTPTTSLSQRRCTLMRQVQSWVRPAL